MNHLTGTDTECVGEGDQPTEGYDTPICYSVVSASLAHVTEQIKMTRKPLQFLGEAFTQQQKPTQICHTLYYSAFQGKSVSIAGFRRSLAEFT